MNKLRKIVLIGMKSSGKTTTGKILAEKLGMPFTDMDTQIELLHAKEKNEPLPFREIYQKYGGDYFRRMETAALEALALLPETEPIVLATGGGLPLAAENRAILGRLGAVVFLDLAPEQLLKRIVAGGIPAFFPHPDDPKRSLDEILAVRRPVYESIAQLTITCDKQSPEEIAGAIIEKLQN
jgi:shikimate kinase